MSAGTASMVSSAGSSALGALGSLAGGNAAAEMGGFNAEQLNQQAGQEQQLGTIAAQRERLQGLQFRGRQVAGYASAGVDLTQGSPVDVLADTAKETEYQAENAKYAHDSRAYQMQVAANLQQFQANQAQEAGVMGAIGGLFKTAAAVAPFAAGFL